METEQIYTMIEVAKATGKIKKGVNEVTKILERGQAKVVIIAEDANPKEIVMHLPILSKEKNVPILIVPSKEELGASAGLPVSTVAIVIIEAGDAKADVESLAKEA